MTDIHPLSVPLNKDGATQLLAVLSGALAEGIDPGPRGPHIRALALSLETLLHKLRGHIVQDFTPANSARPEIQVARAALDQLVRDVETLIVRAQAYPL